MPKINKVNERVKTIVTLIQRRARTTAELFSDINNHLLEDQKISIRSIQQDIRDLKDGIYWGNPLPIQTDNKTGVHSLPENFSFFDFKDLDEDDARSLELVTKMLNIYRDHPLFAKFEYAINKVVQAIGLNQVAGNKPKATRTVIQTHEPPSIKGAEHLGTILTAIMAPKRIRFAYQKFGEDHVEQKDILPLLLKEYAGRWYVVGETLENAHIATFGLDRVSEIQDSTEEAAASLPFDGERFYEDCIGVTNDSTLEPITIVLQFTVFQGNYLKTLPIHPSQTVLEDSQKCFRISIRVKPTWELYQLLLGYGDAVLVESPPSVVSELKKKHRQALRRYRRRT